MDHVQPDVLARAAAFLLLSDSQSSFEIEGERPSADRTRRWSSAIAKAGECDLTITELERLQKIVIGDDRFVLLGIRTDGGFIGHRDRSTNAPLPDHILAKPENLGSLLSGMIAYADRAALMDPVVLAAVLSFGFVYIHPFVDGNGRIHRWLIHHVLAKAGYGPTGVPFPISAAILRNIHAYRAVLESYSRPLMDVIEWSPTEQGNVQVSGETADFYRFFDATAHTEFLYGCVGETVIKDLPEEVAYLRGFDAFVEAAQRVVDMPRETVDLLHRFLYQNDGKLSKRARTREFSPLNEEEVEEIESIYAESHDG